METGPEPPEIRPPRDTHPILALLLVALQYADVGSTWLGMRAGGHELFLLSALVLYLGGWAGLLIAKSAVALFLVYVLIVCERTWPDRRRIAVGAATAFNLWMLLVIVWNLHGMLSRLAHLRY